LGNVAGFFQRKASEPQQETTSKISRFTVGAIEALEAYSSEHAEKLEDLLEWDARRFQTLYSAFVKRKAAEELEQTRLALTAGIWANSNYDQEKGDPRGEFIKGVQDSVDEKIATIYGVAPEEDEFAIDAENPFWAAMYRGLEAQHGTAKPTKDEVDRAIADLEARDMSMDVDQIGEG
jgi:hypothetical protein